jgi:small-conductance mechanosensitive channel
MMAAAQIQMCWLVVLMLPATLQWGLFRIQWVALLSAAVLAVATWFVLRWSLGELVEEIRWRLHLMKSGTNQMFKEIG